MQVFKSYFKILNKHMGQMIMYLSIFIGIMVVLTATRTNKAEGDYEAIKPKFAVFDYDNSSESKALTEYLKKTCIKKNIKNDKKETMQDELFARNVNCILIIKEGFSLDVVTIPGTQAATTFESAINSFTKTYNTYIASGYSEADALAAVNTSLSQKASVSLLSGKSITSHSGIYYCFSYLGWVLLVMMIAGIAPVLQVFSKKEIKERISCSSYKFANYNRELLLGVILTGLVVCARNVNCVLIIKEGFKLDVVTIPGTQAATTFESAINSFTKTYNTYIASGYSEADALAAVNTSLSQKASVSLLSGKNVTSHSGIYYCFSYLGWVLLVMMIAGIAPVLQVFSKKEIKERISCSSYKFANYNRELLLGVILTGLVVCAVIFVSATIMFKGSTFSFSGFLFTLNMLCYMLVSLAFAFFISKITSNSEILNMFANTVSLGMAFLCGIFVPEEFLSDGIIKAAHFLPAYWYNQAVKNIDFHPVKELGFIFMCMGIQLLFAAAIIVVALRITKAPDGIKKHAVAAAAHK